MWLNFDRQVNYKIVPVDQLFIWCHKASMLSINSSHNVATLARKSWIDQIKNSQRREREIEEGGRGFFQGGEGWGVSTSLFFYLPYYHFENLPALLFPAFSPIHATLPTRYLTTRVPSIWEERRKNWGKRKIDHGFCTQQKERNFMENIYWYS